MRDINTLHFPYMSIIADSKQCQRNLLIKSSWPAASGIEENRFMRFYQAKSVRMSVYYQIILQNIVREILLFMRHVDVNPEES